MAFAPDPWDLLIWTEDHGRICIGDLRSNLYARQIVHLEPENDETKTLPLTVSDRTSLHQLRAQTDSEMDSLRRYHRDTQPDSLERYLANAQDRRRFHRQDASSTTEARAPGLSEEEQQILEGLRTSRQREESHVALQQETMTALRRRQETLQDSLNAVRRHEPSTGRVSPRSISYYPSTHQTRGDGVPFSGMAEGFVLCLQDQHAMG